MKKKTTGMVIGAAIAAIALSTVGGSPAMAATYLGAITTTYMGISEVAGTHWSHYVKFSIHEFEGYDYAASTVEIRHINVLASSTIYSPLAGPGSWSYDPVCYGGVIQVGDAVYT